MLILIAVLTFVLPASALRSLLLPLKAIAINLFSPAAAWGVLALVWEQGWRSHILWGLPSSRTIPGVGAGGSLTGWPGCCTCQRERWRGHDD